MTEIVREALTKRAELSIRVAVDGTNREGERGLDIDGNILGNRMRVLVDVELDTHVLLRCTVRCLAAKVIPDGKVGECDRLLRRHCPSLKEGQCV